MPHGTSRPSRCPAATAADRSRRPAPPARPSWGSRGRAAGDGPVPTGRFSEDGGFCRSQCKVYTEYLAVDGEITILKPCTPVVHIKIAGKWMFIPLKMVLGIDPYPKTHTNSWSPLGWHMDLNQPEWRSFMSLNDVNGFDHFRHRDKDMIGNLSWTHITSKRLDSCWFPSFGFVKAGWIPNLWPSHNSQYPKYFQIFPDISIIFHIHPDISRWTPNCLLGKPHLWVKSPTLAARRLGRYRPKGDRRLSPGPTWRIWLWKWFGICFGKYWHWMLFLILTSAHGFCSCLSNNQGISLVVNGYYFLECSLFDGFTEMSTSLADSLGWFKGRCAWLSSCQSPSTDPTSIGQYQWLCPLKFRVMYSGQRRFAFLLLLLCSRFLFGNAVFSLEPNSFRTCGTGNKGQQEL